MLCRERKRTAVLILVAALLGNFLAIFGIFHLSMGPLSFWRNVTWGVQGWRNFTKSGYEKASKSFNPRDLEHDLSGCRAIITGANAGIGESLARGWAERGGSVAMICRSKERGEAARKRIIDETGADPNHVELFLADMADQPGVKSAYEQILESPGAKDAPLCCLINNAGCMVHAKDQNPDHKIDVNFATNTLGTYYLTKLALPELRSQAKRFKEDPKAAKMAPRVVTVSSGGMLTQNLYTSRADMLWEGSGRSLDDATGQYARDKRRQVALTEYWAKQGENAGIGFYSMHPGWGDTAALSKAMPGFYDSMKKYLRTPKQAADTALWLSMQEPSKLENGAFYEDRKPRSKHLPLSHTGYSPDRLDDLVKNLESFL